MFHSQCLRPPINKQVSFADVAEIKKPNQSDQPPFLQENQSFR